MAIRQIQDIGENVGNFTMVFRFLIGIKFWSLQSDLKASLLAFAGWLQLSAIWSMASPFNADENTVFELATLRWGSAHVRLKDCSVLCHKLLLKSNMRNIALKTHVTQVCGQETLSFDVAGKLCSIIDTLDKFSVQKVM